MHEAMGVQGINGDLKIFFLEFNQALYQQYRVLEEHVVVPVSYTHLTLPTIA